VPVFRQTHVCPPPVVIDRATPVEGVTVAPAPEIFTSEIVRPSSPAAMAGSATAATFTVYVAFVRRLAAVGVAPTDPSVLKFPFDHVRVPEPLFVRT